MSTTLRRCESCSRELPLLGRPDRRFCDDACRARGTRERQRAADERLAASDELQEALVRALDEPRLVAIVATAGRRQWRAAAWLLERRYPERWAAGRSVDDEPDPVLTDPGDPFLEVDSLAERRRRKLGYE